jgi:nucleoside-diphosphate-sugar epimerase
MPRIVIVGSAAEYGPGRDAKRDFLNTAESLEPGTLYTESLKSLQTTVAMAYARWGVPGDGGASFSICWRPTHPSHFCGFSGGENASGNPDGEKPAPCASGPRDTVRDFVPLDDALRALSLSWVCVENPGKFIMFVRVEGNSYGGPL